MSVVRGACAPFIGGLMGTMVCALLGNKLSADTLGQGAMCFNAASLRGLLSHASKFFHLLGRLAARYVRSE